VGGCHQAAREIIGIEIFHASEAVRDIGAQHVETLYRKYGGSAFESRTSIHGAAFQRAGRLFANGIRLGVEYFMANDFSAALVASSTPVTQPTAFPASGLLLSLPEWAVFARYDPSPQTPGPRPAKNNEYYTLGFDLESAKIVDFSLPISTTPCVAAASLTPMASIGSGHGRQRGNYNEFGRVGQSQW